MKKFFCTSVALGTLAIINSAIAADLPVKAPPPSPPIALWSWTGFYIGGHVGGGAGNARFSDPFGASIFGDNVSTPFFLAGGQVGYNYQSGQWVFGVEGDASAVVSDGTNTCLAFSGFSISSNCHANPDFLATVTGRLGYALGADGHTLVYAKGGAAFVNTQGDVLANNEFFGFFPQFGTHFSTTKTGWTVGVGLEQALAPAWSLKFEYNYINVDGPSVATPPSIFFPPLGVVLANQTSVRNEFHVAKVGVNYHFGADPWAQWGSPAAAALPVKALPPAVRFAGGWEGDGGARVWFSSGKFQWDNSAVPSIPADPRVLESRLTYDGLSGVSEELFGRLDSPWNVFVKGNVGIGGFDRGHVNDEDWGILGLVSYSNTLSDERNGKFDYGTIDIGYDLWRTATAKIGPFVGYNRYTQRSDSFGCIQIANPLLPCLAPGDNRAVATQDTTWDSLRVGAAAETMFLDRWKLTADIAYIPYTSFSGRDNHLLRAVTTFFDQTGTGQGIQLEGILSYFVTPNFSIGAGARYWAMWTTSGSFTCTGCGGAGVVSGPEQAKYNTERWGAFLQAAYRFDVNAAYH